MAEQKGEIHGVISRQDAWKMWKPYGERIISDLDGTLDPTAILPYEAVHIAAAATPTEQSAIYYEYYDENSKRNWVEDLHTTVAEGPSEQLAESLVEAHAAQQIKASKLRNKVINEGPKRAILFTQAAAKLVDDEVFTSEQVALIETWVFAQDGTPYLQYTPMSKLEYARLSMKYDLEAPDLASADNTDFAFGIYRNAFTQGISYRRTSNHNKVHEPVHGSFSGIEVHDITRVDGLRLPNATVVGHFAYEPTTEIIAGDDFSKVENCELNEGWTEFVARELVRVEPKLGTLMPNDGTGYDAWADKIGEFKKNTPKLFREITRVALVETTPGNPTANRDALRELHEYADATLGHKDSLTAIFAEAGGSLLDIYTKGKTGLVKE